ncbi:MAG: hypothetical protein OSA89_17275, partial [Mariniblastus sp.]|nr:hypothetical protein [Mariniblastus sp.]
DSIRLTGYLDWISRLDISNWISRTGYLELDISNRPDVEYNGKSSAEFQLINLVNTGPKIQPGGRRRV